MVKLSRRQRLFNSGHVARRPASSPAPVLKGTDTLPRLIHAVAAEGHRVSLPGHELAPEGENAMLYTIAVILLIAWLLGIVGTYTIGAFVHVLLVVAIVLFLVGLISGRRLA
jgi:hypothetical protein